MSTPDTASRVVRPGKAPKKPHAIQGGSSEATRFAVVILEVLAGERTPGDAAKALGVTPPRYYQLETRALGGLVAALEPRPKGKQPSWEGRVSKLEKQLGEAHRERLRQQALVRAAQRSLGIKPPPAVEDKHSGKDAAGRKKRRPTVRALKAARALARATRPPEAESVQQESTIDRPADAPVDREHGPLEVAQCLLKESQDDTRRTQAARARPGGAPGRIATGQTAAGDDSGDDRRPADDRPGVPTSGNQAGDVLQAADEGA